MKHPGKDKVRQLLASREHADPETIVASASRTRVWSSGRVLVLIMAAAAVFRLLAAMTHPMIQGDELVYARMAESLSAGKGLLELTGDPSTHFTPLLSIFMAGLSYVAGDVIISGYLVVIFFETLVLLPVYLLGREFISERVGLMATALAAVIPLLIDFSSQIYSESVYIFFLLFAVYYGWCLLRDGRIVCGVLAGASLGLAYLANPAATFYLFAISGLALVVALYRRSWRRMLPALSLFLVVFSVFAAPYVFYLHHELGKWTYSNKNVASNLYAAIHNQKLLTPELEQDSMALNAAGTEVREMEMVDQNTDPLSFLLRHPLQGLRIFSWDIKIFYGSELPQVLPLWLLPLLGLGLFAGTWDRRRALAVGYTVLMMAPALLILSIDYRKRFFVPFTLLAVIWIALGWQRFEDWGQRSLVSCFSRETGARWRGWLSVAVAVMVLVPPLLYATVIVEGNSYTTQYKDTGEWIKQELGPGKRIMDRAYTSTYYAGGTVVLFPYDSYERTTAYAYQRDVEYLVIQKQNIATWRPGMSRLLEADGRHPEWRLVKTIRPGAREETLIYELVAKPPLRPAPES